ncbi:hypothetical protein PVAND_004697 [Polypedilum vanderplanki]|uniref:Uncharacterized protein n=1 Tax=Polypedilum vanderplanki TaxID=319348 RepID=A0A9J6BYC0_POLVA|nr:hypothetical protein PVAND_004697 [Polypedilum vanderplanki]
MCTTYESVLKDFQNNINNFVNSIESLSVSTQNLAKIMNHVDPNHSTISKSYLALLDWSQNLFILAERFEADFKSQLSTCIDQEIAQPEHCKIRITMGNIYEKILFFLNHMTHSFIDYSRSESPMSASNFDCHSLASGPPNSIALQRLRMLQQQQQAMSNRRWSEAACTTENNEANVDANRRWSMPTNVSKTRLNNKSLAGLVTQQQQQQQQTQFHQSTNSNDTNDGANNEWIAIQLLSFRPSLPSRSPSQMQHCSQMTQPFQYLAPRNTQQQSQQPTRQQRQTQELILPRNDSLFTMGRCQQIAENIRGETDEYQ